MRHRTTGLPTKLCKPIRRGQPQKTMGTRNVRDNVHNDTIHSIHVHEQEGRGEVQEEEGRREKDFQIQRRRWRRQIWTHFHGVYCDVAGSVVL